MKVIEQPGTHIARGPVEGQATAGTVDEWAIFRAQAALKIVAIYWIPNAAVTGANTNNFALQAINRGAAGAGTTAPTAVKTYASGTNGVQNSPEALTLSSTATDLNMAAGDVLALVRTINGTGLAMPDGIVEVHYQFR